MESDMNIDELKKRAGIGEDEQFGRFSDEGGYSQMKRLIATADQALAQGDVAHAKALLRDMLKALEVIRGANA